jgi:hypothetical protein
VVGISLLLCLIMVESALMLIIGIIIMCLLIDNLQDPTDPPFLFCIHSLHKDYNINV